MSKYEPTIEEQNQEAMDAGDAMRLEYDFFTDEELDDMAEGSWVDPMEIDRDEEIKEMEKYAK